VELQKKGGSADGRRKLVKAELIKWCAKLECIQRLLEVMAQGPPQHFFSAESPPATAAAYTVRDAHKYRL
jgi:hypothetical protein